MRDNAVKIDQALDRLIQQLAVMKAELESLTLGEKFQRAGTFRTAILLRSKGFLKPLHRIAVNIINRPGALAHMTTVMAQAGINIKDIELLKVRENVGGTFHLYFDTRTDAERAVQ